VQPSWSLNCVGSQRWSEPPHRDCPDSSETGTVVSAECLPLGDVLRAPTPTRLAESHCVDILLESLADRCPGSPARSAGSALEQQQSFERIVTPEWPEDNEVYSSSHHSSSTHSRVTSMETVTRQVRGVAASYSGLLFTQDTCTAYDVLDWQFYYGRPVTQTPSPLQNMHIAERERRTSMAATSGAWHRAGYGGFGHQALVEFPSSTKKLCGVAPDACRQSNSDSLHSTEDASEETHAAAIQQRLSLADAISNSSRSSTVKDPEPDSSGFPSVGSVGHAKGRCKPCAFLYTKGCGNGANCSFCHLCEDGEKKTRRKAKIETKKLTRRLHRWGIL